MRAYGSTCVVAASLLASLAHAAAPSAPTLYALENLFPSSSVPTPPLLHTLNPEDGAILTTIAVSMPEFTLATANGLARRPSDGALFAALGTVDPTPATGVSTFTRRLCVLDPATGVATPIGALSDRISTLAFLQDGRLFGVTGDGASVPETLFEIDPATAALTEFATLGNGSDGEAIAATDEPATLFHASGLGKGTEHFERLDLSAAGAECVVDLDPDHMYGFDDEILALAWSDTLGAMFMTARTDSLYRISTTSGDIAEVGGTGLYLKGLAFDGETLYALQNGRGSFGSNALHTLNPLTGATLTSVSVTLPGAGLVVLATALARHPITGELYAVLGLDDDSRHLVRLDATTGEGTDVGTLADKIAGLAFRADGTLVGVTGDGASQPEKLFIISTTDASMAPLFGLGNGADGESIAIAADGALYHASGIDPGDQRWERVDLDCAPFIADIGDGSHTFDYDEVMALAHSRTLDAMYLSDGSGDLFTIDTATGATSLVGHIGAPKELRLLKGLAFTDNGAVAPCPGDTNGDGVIDFFDLNNVLSSFGLAEGDPGYIAGADLNNDDVVDFLDLNIVLSFFGAAC